MKIAVLSGSPKGETSVTVQYVRYLEKVFPEHNWSVHHIAQQIGKLEKDEVAFTEVIDDVRSADGVLWACPLYILLVCSQVKRFIELVNERGANDVFRDKHTATLTTSIHFHDHCAHDYLQAVCEDWGMRVVGRFAPAMQDLTEPAGQQKLRAFGAAFLTAIDRNEPSQRRFAELRPLKWQYDPGPDPDPVDIGNRRVVIVHDTTVEQHNLRTMVERLRNSFSGSVAVHNLWDVDIKGGCLGCLRCGGEYQCAWTGKDGFIDWYRSELMTADMLVFAGTVIDRHLSSRWRNFFDRGFFLTHTPSFKDKQLAFLVSGPLTAMPELRQVLRAYASWQETNLVGIVSDESGESVQLDELLSTLARRMVDADKANYIQPFDFLGAGGRLIFRDNIYSDLQLVFMADHRYYAHNGYYDFPTRRWGQRLLNGFLRLILRIPRVRSEYEKRFKTGMISAHQRVLASARPEAEAEIKS